MRLLVVLCVATLTMAASAAAVNEVHATMSTSSTLPLVDTPWRYTITVEDQTGKPLAATVRLQTLRGRRVVGCWTGSAFAQCAGANAGTWISFRGKRTGTIMWPARLAGTKLTFQATVVAGTHSLELRAPLTVRLP